MVLSQWETLFGSFQNITLCSIGAYRLPWPIISGVLQRSFLKHTIFAIRMKAHGPNLRLAIVR